MSELQQFCASCGGAISYTAEQAGTSIFCLHCGQKVQLKSDSATPPEPSQSPPPPAINDTPEEFFLFIDNQQHGPYSEANLSEYLKAGQITPETLVWWEGKQGWEPLSQQTELNLGLISSSSESGLAPTAVAPERPMAMESPEADEENTYDNSTTCETCGNTFKSEKKLLKHQRKQGHGDFEEEDDDDDDDDDTYFAKDCVCGETAKLTGDLLQSYIDDEQSYECEECEREIDPSFGWYSITLDKFVEEEGEEEDYEEGTQWEKILTNAIYACCATFLVFKLYGYVSKPSNKDNGGRAKVTQAVVPAKPQSGLGSKPKPPVTALKPAVELGYDQKVNEAFGRYRQYKSKGLDEKSILYVVKLGWDTFETTCNSAHPKSRHRGFVVSQVILHDVANWFDEKYAKTKKQDMALQSLMIYGAVEMTCHAIQEDPHASSVQLKGNQDALRRIKDAIFIKELQLKDDHGMASQEIKKVREMGYLKLSKIYKKR